MSISAVSSNSLIPTVLTSAQQQQQDLATLTSSIKAGDIAGAKTALAAFQQSLQSGPSAAGKGNPAQDLQNLQSALGSNDVSGAQSALTTLLQDLKQAKSHHHHHKQASSTDANTQNVNNAATDTSTPSSGINLTA